MVRLKVYNEFKMFVELWFSHSKFMPSLIFTWKSVETQSKTKEQFKNCIFQGSLFYHDQMLKNI